MTIPSGVTSIGEYAFSGCYSLTSVAIPSSVTSIEEAVFVQCSSLTSVTIPDSVTSIGESAFDGCSSLTNVKIPDNITNIERATFAGCTSLASVTIPSSVTRINDDLFEGCKNLTDIYYRGSEQQWKKVYIETGAIPDGTTIHFNSGSSDTVDDNNSGNKDNSQSSSNTTAISISVSAPKYNTLQLVWEPVEGAASYEVYYAASPTDDFKLLKKVKKSLVKFSKANCGQTYYFKVIAYQKSGKTFNPVASGQTSGRTQLAGELNPSAKATYKSVALKWKKIKGVKEYAVLRSDGTVISGLKSAKYTDKNVEAGKTYTYSVAAVSYGEDRITSNITASTYLTKAPKLKVKATSVDTLMLSWSKVPGAVFYDIYSVDIVTGETVLIETVNAAQRAFTITGLNPVTSYKYMVVARAGESEKASQQVVQTTKAI